MSVTWSQRQRRSLIRLSTDLPRCITSPIVTWRRRCSFERSAAWGRSSPRTAAVSNDGRRWAITGISFVYSSSAWTERMLGGRSNKTYSRTLLVIIKGSTCRLMAVFKIALNSRHVNRTTHTHIMRKHPSARWRGPHTNQQTVKPSNCPRFERSFARTRQSSWQRCSYWMPRYCFLWHECIRESYRLKTPSS